MTPTRTDAAAPEKEAERLRRLLDAVTDDAIYLLDNDGFVRSWNSGAVRLGWRYAFDRSSLPTPLRRSLRPRRDGANRVSSDCFQP
jgi:PAS domain-containing protein